MSDCSGPSDGLWHDASLVTYFDILVEALGRVSYSGYLWHFALLHLASAAYLGNPLESLDLAGGWPSFLAFFAGLVIATFGLSAFTHRYVERPGIEFGRHFARAWRRARAIA
jgi:peptidoglycan/LPS O-acetylase OafA/YrhL